MFTFLLAAPFSRDYPYQMAANLPISPNLTLCSNCRVVRYHFTDFKARKRSSGKEAHNRRKRLVVAGEDFDLNRRDRDIR
jgi:hypothetical protein